MSIKASSIYSFIEHQTGETLSSCAVTIDKIDLLKLLSIASAKEEIYFFTSKPEDKIAFLAFDALLSINEGGADRVKNTSSKIEKWQNNFTSNWNEFHEKSFPLFLGGMKFSSGEYNELWKDYTDSDWFVPKFLFFCKEDKFYFVYNFIAKDNSLSIAESDLRKVSDFLREAELINNGFNSQNKIIKSNLCDLDEKQNWIEKVNEALEKIDNEEFQKIVLSRQVNLELDGKPNFPSIINDLSARYPKCYVFAYKKGDSIFFGASPEKLAKISNGWIEADALAGSTQRGENEMIDKELEKSLLNSSKNLAEQQAVVEFITNSFSSFSSDIQYSKKPIIRKLPNIQHLWTPIKAKLNTDKNIFSILKEIHPTPAICGVPWTNALVSIKKMENHKRGLFAGMVGWFNFENEAEFAVAIRSALSKQNFIFAFAGCGIVKGSDPISEYEEAELKLQPILSLFKNEKIHQS